MPIANTVGNWIAGLVFVLAVVLALVGRMPLELAAMFALAAVAIVLR